MWLLSSEPQSAWLVLSHDPGAPQAVRFHQPFGSWACSSQHPPLPPSTLIQSTAVHLTFSASQRLYPFYSPHNYCVNGNSPWLTSFHILTPPNKAGKINNYPYQPATKQLHISNICIMWQILSAIRPLSPSVWRPCVISILSKSPKIVSCFYPALCSFLLSVAYKAAWWFSHLDQIQCTAAKSCGQKTCCQCSVFICKKMNLYWILTV